MDQTEKRSLPQDRRLSLTEALTYAVFGDCMNDAQWSIANAESYRCWGKMHNLRAVLKFAKAWANGEPRSANQIDVDWETNEYEKVDFRSIIERAENFNGDIQAFCDALQEHIETVEANGVCWSQFVNTLQSLAQSGKVEVGGKPCEAKPKHRVLRDRETIPADYFVDGVCIVCGEDRLDPSSSTPTSDADLLAWALYDSDNRCAYSEPRISQSDFSILHQRYLEAMGAQSCDGPHGTMTTSPPTVEQVRVFLVGYADGTKTVAECHRAARDHFYPKRVPDKSRFRPAWGQVSANQKLQRGQKKK